MPVNTARATDHLVSYFAACRPTFGYRKLLAYLRSCGWKTSEYQVRRVLRAMRRA